MNLPSRLGLRRDSGTLPDDSAIFLTRRAAEHEANAGLKSPQVRTIRRTRGVAAPATADETPYPSREEAAPPSLIDRARLTIEEWELAERLAGPIRAAASRFMPRFAIKLPSFALPTIKLPVIKLPGLKLRPKLRPAPKPAAAKPVAPAAPKAVAIPPAKVEPKPAPAPVAKPMPVPVAKPVATPVAKPAPAPAAKVGPRPAAKSAPPPPATPAKRKKLDRGDVTLGALGIVLALTCALFPWYIFFNQEKFGVREFVFEGSGQVTPPSQMVYQPPLVGQHFQTGEVPKMDLDLFPTATTPSDDEQRRTVPASEQPFPSDLVSFRLVHVANGRAMIQDDDGLWIVQPGSRLPDASQVASIEQRKGRWVLVTTLDKVVQLEP